MVYSETLLTSTLENLYFDFEIAPVMCKLWVDEAASTELIAWIKKNFNIQLIDNEAPALKGTANVDSFPYFREIQQ